MFTSLEELTELKAKTMKLFYPENKLFNKKNVRGNAVSSTYCGSFKKNIVILVNKYLIEHLQKINHGENPVKQHRKHCQLFM